MPAKVKKKPRLTYLHGYKNYNQLNASTMDELGSQCPKVGEREYHGNSARAKWDTYQPNCTYQNQGLSDVKAFNMASKEAVLLGK